MCACVSFCILASFTDSASVFLCSVQVTQNWDVLKTYTALAGVERQAIVVDAIQGEYLQQLTYGIANVCEDALSKEELLKVWTTKNINFAIEKKGYETDPKKKEICHQESGNGIRISAGAGAQGGRGAAGTGAVRAGVSAAAERADGAFGLPHDGRARADDFGVV